ncbi:MAG: rRNA pseudouridine synthase [Syntrophomonadaceae bacterium]|nr:rRNA pseudouridine synthase [Syntrophomonadaceae bacterium]NLX02011.1 rRNA pseudouridine synthase [Syntrophomonadaceae bacterium]
MRLAKYLAEAGVASRRKAEELIMQGRVKINGLVVKEKGCTINPDVDRVEFDGRIISREEKVYILLNKPAGYISSVFDPQGRPTVMELLKDIKLRIYPVGRLDFDTEGLLLLSNDGDFTNLMIHPRYEINKTYQALVKGKPDKKSLQILQEGIQLEDGITAPARVNILKTFQDRTLLEIEIHEGRKRQVKRMCLAVGHPVISLKRTTFGSLKLQGVAPGKYRFLTPSEVNRLKQQASDRG